MRLPNSSTIHLTDGYKLDHRRQYPEETCLVYSNWTPRKSRMEGIDWVVVFGLQYFIKEYVIKDFNENFFGQPKTLVCARYTRRINNYLGPNKIGIQHMEALHDLGYLPLCIKSLPEGMRTRLRIPHATLYSTIDQFFWLVNYLETIWSCSTWQSSTSATLASAFHKDALYWAKRTGGDIDFIPFQCHDFSFRGMSSLETACMSGAAHLLSFRGTDTVPAIDFLEEYYNADSDKEFVGGSIAATEHAVMCVGTGFYIRKEDLSWEYYGKAEYDVFERLLTVVYPNGNLSVVSDTWNLWIVLREYLPRLKEVILARDGKLVIRPDSGDPVKIMTGYMSGEYDEVDGECYRPGDVQWLESMPPKPYVLSGSSPMCLEEVKGVVQCLFDIFGGTLNTEGNIRLCPKIGAIYGDSINRARFNEICERLETRGFESTSWVAGVGSFTYQYNTRDTFGWAMKATYAEAMLNGERIGIPIFKDPITDDGTKKSLKGLIILYEEDGEILAKDECSWEEERQGLLVEVFRDGKLLVDHKLSEIRERMIA